MSLNNTTYDPRTIEESAKVKGKARTVLKNVSVEELITQPAH